MTENGATAGKAKPLSQIFEIRPEQGTLVMTERVLDVNRCRFVPLYGYGRQNGTPCGGDRFGRFFMPDLHSTHMVFSRQ